MYTWYKKISKLFLTKCAYSQCNLRLDSSTMKPNAWFHSKICRWLIVTSATQILAQFVGFVIRRPRLVVRQDIPTLGYNILRWRQPFVVIIKSLRLFPKCCPTTISTTNDSVSDCWLIVVYPTSVLAPSPRVVRQQYQPSTIVCRIVAWLLCIQHQSLHPLRRQIKSPIRSIWLFVVTTDPFGRQSLLEDKIIKVVFYNHPRFSCEVVCVYP